MTALTEDTIRELPHGDPLHALCDTAMGRELKPPRDCALVAIGYRHTAVTGRAWECRTGDTISVPDHTQTREPQFPQWDRNDKYAMFVGEALASRHPAVEAEVEAYSVNPRDFGLGEVATTALSWLGGNWRVDLGSCGGGSVWGCDVAWNPPLSVDAPNWTLAVARAVAMAGLRIFPDEMLQAWEDING